MTRGVYTYDYGNSGGYTSKMKMHSLGHTYYVPPIHAGGLRYHGTDAQHTDKSRNCEPIAYHQNEVFQAAHLFAKTEGIVPAPESSHAIKGVIDRALQAKKEGKEEVILFNLSGHGLLDLKGYEDYLDRKLEGYEPEEFPALNL